MTTQEEQFNPEILQTLAQIEGEIDNKLQQKTEYKTPESMQGEINNIGQWINNIEGIMVKIAGKK